MSRKWPRIILVVLVMLSLGILLLVNLNLGNLEDLQPTFTFLPVPAENVSGISFDGNSLWITIDGGHTIHQVDLETGKSTRKIEFPAKATGGSAWAGDFLWQLAYEEKTIYKLNLDTGEIVGTIPSPGSGMCCGMTYDGKNIWVANFEDEKIYQINQNDGGKILKSLDTDFETTGLAWDGKALWNGILVGTVDHDEKTPYTGFVQQRHPTNKAPLRVLPIPGVGPGTSDWTIGSGQANRFWWYDGFHQKIIQVETRHGTTSNIRLMVAALFLLTIIPAVLAWRGKAALS